MGPLGATLERVGDRWMLLIVDALMDGPHRFGELQAEVEPIAPNILSARLKRLEAEGILLARPYTRRPLRFSYELTASGRELAGAIRLLADWGARSAGGEPIRHAECGTPMEARWYCPTCSRAVRDEEAESELHYV